MQTPPHITSPHPSCTSTHAYICQAHSIPTITLRTCQPNFNLLSLTASSLAFVLPRKNSIQFTCTLLAVPAMQCNAASRLHPHPHSHPHHIRLPFLNSEPDSEPRSGRLASSQSIHPHNHTSTSPLTSHTTHHTPHTTHHNTAYHINQHLTCKPTSQQVSKPQKPEHLTYPFGTATEPITNHRNGIRADGHGENPLTPSLHHLPHCLGIRQYNNGN